MTTIAKKIPIPAHKNSKYPFAKMEVGESFLVQSDKAQQVRNASAQFVRENQPEWKFSTIRVGLSTRCFRKK